MKSFSFLFSMCAVVSFVSAGGDGNLCDSIKAQVVIIMHNYFDPIESQVFNLFHSFVEHHSGPPFTIDKFEERLREFVTAYYPEVMASAGLLLNELGALAGVSGAEKVAIWLSGAAPSPLFICLNEADISEFRRRYRAYRTHALVKGFE